MNYQPSSFYDRSDIGTMFHHFKLLMDFSILLSMEKIDTISTNKKIDFIKFCLADSGAFSSKAAIHVS